MEDAAGTCGGAPWAAVLDLAAAVVVPLAVALILLLAVVLEQRSRVARTCGVPPNSRPCGRRARWRDLRRRR